MTSCLSMEQKELVAVGAAIAANCEPCLRIHLRRAGEAGLSGEQLRAAVEVAQEVKETPARLIREAAARFLTRGPAATSPDATDAGCCG